jgi:hypothetical protein
MTQEPRPILGLIIAIIIGLVAMLVSGCSQPLYRAPYSPVIIMTPTPTKNPAFWVGGQWEQVKGTVTLQPGETSVQLPATQPVTNLP